MPEYLAPGVFIEEVSYRSKSIEGVSTTTTGFVGPTRYGPVEIEPDVITNVTEFERVYGDGRQLDFGSEDGTLHNYLWHGVRSFFEEGGKRLYVARTFRPVVSAGGNGYKAPPNKLKDDHALPTSDRYETDGHARCWLTTQTAAMSAALRTVDDLGSAIREANGLMAAVIKEKDTALPLQFDTSLTPIALPNPKAEKADNKVADAALLLKLGLEDATAPDSTVTRRLKSAVTAISKVETAYDAQTMNASEVQNQLDMAVAKAKNAVATADNLKQADEIDALKATSDYSKSTAADAYELLGGVKAAADLVVTDEGVSTTDIAKLADAISKSCETSGTGLTEGDTHKKLSDAKVAATKVAGDAVAAVAAGTAEADAKLSTAKTSATDLVGKSATAASACNALTALALRLLNQAYVDGKQDDPRLSKLTQYFQIYFPVFGYLFLQKTPDASFVWYRGYLLLPKFLNHRD